MKFSCKIPQGIEIKTNYKIRYVQFKQLSKHTKSFAYSRISTHTILALKEYSKFINSLKNVK